MTIMGAVTTGDMEKLVTTYAVRNARFYDANVMRENPLEQFFPFETADEQEFEFWTGSGQAGVMGVDREAAVPYSKSALKRHQEDLTTDKYAYFMSNDMLERAAKATGPGGAKDPASRYAADGNIFFGEVRQYKQIAALLAGAGQTVVAAGTWDTTSPEGAITEALDKLGEYGWKAIRGPAVCIVPQRVFRGVMQQRAVRGGYTSVAQVLKDSYSIEFIPFAPWYVSGAQRKIDVLTGTDSDILGTSAILAVGSGLTMQSLDYKFKNTPAQFVEIVSDQGYGTIIHRVQGAKVIPKYEEAATTVDIVKITGVATAR
jgi:hypothetical protein